MEEKEREQYEKLVLTPIRTLIPMLAWPTVLSMMISMIYNLVDAFFVGRLGTSASAAIGVVMSLQTIFQAVGFMFGHGSGTIISRKLGQGEREDASRYLSGALKTGLLVSLVLVLLGFLFLTPLMRFMGSSDTILPYAKNYAAFILLCGPAMVGSCVLNNVMRYEGKAFFAMLGLVSGGVLNMLGDPLFMFGFHMGITGAGLSTALSQYVSFFILLYMFLSHKTVCRIDFRKSHLAVPELLHILQNGFPSLIRQSLNGISTMVLNNAALPYGDAAIAAMSIAGRVMMFIASVMVGIGQGFQPVAAYNYGAEKFKRIREAFFFAFRTGELVLCVLAVIGFLFPSQIVAVFRDDPEVIRIGVPAVRCMCIAAAIQPTGVLGNMLFQSIGESKTASFLAMLRSGLYYIPLVFLLPRFFGIFGIQSAQMLADILTLLTTAPFLAVFFRKLPDENRETVTDRLYRGENMD